MTYNDASIDWKKVNAIINWYYAEVEMNEYNCSYSMTKLDTDNKLLIKELKRRAQLMQLNWEEFVHVSDATGVIL